jgi:hypothetical protein
MPAQRVNRIDALLPILVPRIWRRSVVPSRSSSCRLSSIQRGHDSRTSYTDIAPVPQAQRGLGTVGTPWLKRNWLKPIFPVLSCVQIALSAFGSPVYSLRIVRDGSGIKVLVKIPLGSVGPGLRPFLPHLAVHQAVYSGEVTYRLRFCRPSVDGRLFRHLVRDLVALGSPVAQYERGEGSCQVNMSNWLLRLRVSAQKYLCQDASGSPLKIIEN